MLGAGTEVWKKSPLHEANVRVVTFTVDTPEWQDNGQFFAGY